MQLLEEGVAAVKLRSLTEVRTAFLRELPELLDGPTFQFCTDTRHPIGGAVTMFAPCSVRTSSSAVTLPLSPAPRYGQHTREILNEIGVSAEALLACGAASESWSKEYLPGYKPLEPMQVLAPECKVPPKISTHRDSLALCPVCLQSASQLSSMMELSCSHVLCTSCAVHCSSSGHGRCPVCRHPHLLDPERLQNRMNKWRQAYGNWRLGGTHGAVGEVSDMSAPISPQRSAWIQEKSWVLTAGDLLSANSELCKQSNLQEVTVPRRLKSVMTVAGTSLADLYPQNAMQEEQCKAPARLYDTENACE